MPHPVSHTDETLLDYTIEVFQPRTCRVLTRDDAQEIVGNLTSFFRILMEWDAKERASGAATGGAP